MRKDPRERPSAKRLVEFFLVSGEKVTLDELAIDEHWRECGRPEHPPIPTHKFSLQPINESTIDDENDLRGRTKSEMIFRSKTVQCKEQASDGNIKNPNESFTDFQQSLNTGRRNSRNINLILKGAI